MGYIYLDKTNFEDALLFFYRSIHCHMQKHSSQHPSIVELFTIIGKIYSIKHLSTQKDETLNQLFNKQLDKQALNKKLLFSTYQLIKNENFQRSL